MHTRHQNTGGRSGVRENIVGEQSHGDSAGTGRGSVDWRHLVGTALLVLTAALVGIAASGAVAAQDQPGDPVNVYGTAEDEIGTDAPVGTTIYAVVDGEVEDSITVEEEGQFGGGEAFDDKLAINDGAGEEVVFAIQSPDGATAFETLDLDSAGEVVEVNLTFPGASFTQLDVTGDGDPATDTTGDGLLNDVDGDGGFNIFDVQDFFNNFDTETVQNNQPAFDFNGDEDIDIFDVQNLFNRLTE